MMKTGKGKKKSDRKLYPRDGDDGSTANFSVRCHTILASDTSSAGSSGMSFPSTSSMGSRGERADPIVLVNPPQEDGCLAYVEDQVGDVPEAEETVAATASSPVGLINEGCTCYLNSLLQLLFHLRYFRNAVYLTPTEDGGEGCAIPRALQSLFYQMEMRKRAAHTKKLTSSFGWTNAELFIQHDIQEMATLLRDNLEERMKGTVAEGFINHLFQGVGEQVVMTLDKTFCSRRRDTFYDIHLPLGPHATLVESLRSLTAKELLVGDNKYRVEEPGKEPQYKDAEKSYEFRRFSPVIWFHLKRFEMDLTSPSLEMKKVNSRLEFPVELSLQEFEQSEAMQKQPKGGGGGEEENASLMEGGERCAQKDDEKEKRSSHETTEADNPPPLPSSSGSAYPFSTDSPAIYDLQGVIVHRGSVRSGHYYCYIREWDPLQGKFTRWFEFDDDRVAVVPEILAVNDNFGGPLLRQGKHNYTLATHNAYILSYVRRADCAQVFAPSPTEIVSQCVKEELQREILEDGRREEEENEQRRKLTLFVITDEIISDYVHKYQRETFPKEMHTSDRIGIRLDMHKTDTLQAVYEAVASHPKLRTFELKPNEFRLWLSQPGRHIRPSVPLLMQNGSHDIIMKEYLELGGDEKNIMICRYLYLQRPTILRPFPVTDATSLVKDFTFKESLNYTVYFVTLEKPVQLDGVTFYLEQSVYRSIQGCIQLILRDEEGQRYEYRKGHTTFDQVIFVRVNMEKKLIVSLEFVIDASHVVGVPVKVRDLRLSAPTSALLSLQPTFFPGKAMLPPIGNERVLLFFKYFNYITCRVVYAGSAVVPLTATVGSCTDVLRNLLGEDGASSDRFQMFEEKQNSSRPLRNDEMLITAHITNASVLIGQRDEIPQVFRHTRLDCYVDSVPHIIPVHIHHIVFDEFSAPHSSFFNSEGGAGRGVRRRRSSSTRSRSSSSSGSDSGHRHHQNNNSSSGNRNNNNKNWRYGGDSAVEVVLSTLNVEENNCSTAFYPPRKFHVVATYKHFLNLCWTCDEACEAVGVLSGHDPNFIRFYRSNNTNKMELATPEADPLLGISSLDNIIKKNQKPELFFEIVRVPRRILEERPRVVLTFYTEHMSLYLEKVVIWQQITFRDLLRGMLERYAKMVQRASETDSNEEVQCSSTTQSEMNKDTSDKEGSSRCPFRIGLHYLALVVDSLAGVITKIIEVPMECEDSSFNSGENSTSSLTNTIDDSSGSCFFCRGNVVDCGHNCRDGGKGVDEECLRFIGVQVEPLTLYVVPAEPPRKGFFRVACCHGELSEVYSVRPTVFGQPFVITLSKSATVSEVLETLLSYTGVPPSEVASRCDSVMMYAETLERFPIWSKPLFSYWSNTCRNSDRVPTLLLNHKRPREKPGSRYVAQNNPTLRISRN